MLSKNLEKIPAIPIKKITVYMYNIISFDCLLSLIIDKNLKTFQKTNIIKILLERYLDFYPNNTLALIIK
jgi:hypothetical protein|tara:strand:+ start:4110 stop:4319 length:210 start_codon:yes stop_codon:yes gene_type:complete